MPSPVVPPVGTTLGATRGTTGGSIGGVTPLPTPGDTPGVSHGSALITIRKHCFLRGWHPRRTHTTSDFSGGNTGVITSKTRLRRLSTGVLPRDNLTILLPGDPYSGGSTGIARGMLPRKAGCYPGWFPGCTFVSVIATPRAPHRGFHRGCGSARSASRCDVGGTRGVCRKRASV